MPGCRHNSTVTRNLEIRHEAIVSVLAQWTSQTGMDELYLNGRVDRMLLDINPILSTKGRTTPLPFIAALLFIAIQSCIFELGPFNVGSFFFFFNFFSGWQKLCLATIWPHQYHMARSTSTSVSSYGLKHDLTQAAWITFGKCLQHLNIPTLKKNSPPLIIIWLGQLSRRQGQVKLAWHSTLETEWTNIEWLNKNHEVIEAKSVEGMTPPMHWGGHCDAKKRENENKLDFVTITKACFLPVMLIWQLVPKGWCHVGMSLNTLTVT